MISISKIYTFFSKKPAAGTSEPLRIVRVWSIELIIAALLLIAALGFDVWVYQKFAAPGNTTGNGLTNGVVSLNREDIISLNKTFETNENFLKAPTFPLIGNPF